jgi:hypothetical protein
MLNKFLRMLRMKRIVFLLCFLLLPPLFFSVEKLESKDRVNGNILPGQVDNVEAPSGNGPAQTGFAGMNEGRRLTTDDPGEIMRVINEINESKGFNIVFVGDSIVYGDGTMEENRTIPGALAQKLSRVETGQAVHVFNLTLPSAGPAEVYLITRELAKAKVDLLIYDLNIGWLDRAEKLEHPVLLELGDNRSLDPADFDVAGLDGETPNYYNLYNEDDNLRDLATSWTGKSWEGILDAEDMGKYGRVNLEWSEQWDYLRETVSLLQEHHIKSLFFTNPKNFALFEQYDLIDYPSYHTTIEAISEYLTDAGVMTLDLDEAVPSVYFSDLVHLLPEGEEIVAGRLYDFVTQSGIVAAVDVE